VLIAYLDEFGHVGPYVGREHPRHNAHPVFGYAGYVIPAENARYFSAEFVRVKRSLFKTEIDQAKSPAQWERKGAEYFSTGSIEKRPEQVRAFTGLVQKLGANGGKLFYYGDEKIRGTAKETGKTAEVYTVEALRETINRICRYAAQKDEQVLIFMDDFTEKSRRELVAQMYGHIYERTKTYEEMKRIVEPPLHIDSKVNSSVQFADWVCGLVGRAADYQLIDGSSFAWVKERFGNELKGKFTYESKIRLLGNGPDIQNNEILWVPGSVKRTQRIGSVGNLHPELGGFYETLRSGMNDRMRA
jgi:hypothetical protein